MGPLSEMTRKAVRHQVQPCGRPRPGPAPQTTKSRATRDSGWHARTGRRESRGGDASVPASDRPRGRGGTAAAPSPAARSPALTCSEVSPQLHASPCDPVRRGSPKHSTRSRSMAGPELDVRRGSTKSAGTGGRGLRPHRPLAPARPPRPAPPLASHTARPRLRLGVGVALAASPLPRKRRSVEPPGHLCTPPGPPPALAPRPCYVSRTRLLFCGPSSIPTCRHLLPSFLPFLPSPGYFLYTRFIHLRTRKGPVRAAHLPP